MARSTSTQTPRRKKRTITHAWVIWLLSSIFMFYKYAIEVSPGVMTSTLMTTFQIDGVQLGNLAASYFYAYLLLQIPAGMLIDRLGPRRVTTIAIAVCAIGCIVFSKANSLWMASIGRFLSGAGGAFAAVNCLKLTANWFAPAQFAFMAGLMMTVAMLGAVGGQTPLSYFIQTLDWRYAINLLGLAGIILSLIFWLITRDLSPEKRKETHLAPQRFSLRTTLKMILKNTQSWWLSIYSGFAFAPLMVFGGLWGTSFISEAYQMSIDKSASLVSLIFIGFAAGAPLFGWISDRIGRRVVLMSWGTLIATLSLSCAIYWPGISSLWCGILLFLFGFSLSSFLLCFTLIREINVPILAATAVGFMNAFDALFGAFSDPMTGKLLDLFWNGQMLNGARIFSIEAYKMAFLTLPIYLIISLLCLFKIKETHCNQYSPTSLP